MSNPLINNSYLLKKYPGKGGWTYAEIPEIPQDKNNPFGWVGVKGSIDDHSFEHHKLMPMGNGKLFFSVNANIRKKIKKEAGDTVKIILYPLYEPDTIPQEIMDAFSVFPKTTFHAWEALSDSQKNNYIQWIFNANSEEEKINRINEMMDQLDNG